LPRTARPPAQAEQHGANRFVTVRNTAAKIKMPAATSAPPRLVEMIGHAAIIAAQSNRMCWALPRKPPVQCNIHQKPRHKGQSRLKYCAAFLALVRQ
jgi:hypothetical protein